MTPTRESIISPFYTSTQTEKSHVRFYTHQQVPVLQVVFGPSFGWNSAAEAEAEACPVHSVALLVENPRQSLFARAAAVSCAGTVSCRNGSSTDQVQPAVSKECALNATLLGNREKKTTKKKTDGPRNRPRRRN